jgi:GTP diphosphokinase / guanosine-3',5'-bis(diphosphate) 3'-diphosphatase
MFARYKAMMFAREAHKDQRRKYTGAPYADHLAEVAGIVACVAPLDMVELAVSVAWLHDCMEDQAVSHDTLRIKFGEYVADGVQWLSDLEQGNRAERKAQSRERLSRAPGWVQSIKCADLISNTSSIVMHDPKFAVLYLEEKRLLLDVLTAADPRLLKLARQQTEATPCVTS